MCSSMHSRVEDLPESSVNKNKIKIKILTGEFVFVCFSLKFIREMYLIT